MISNELKDQFTNADKLQLANCRRRLLRETFIVRDKEDDRKIYNFIIRKENQDYLREWFEDAGYDLVIDTNAGVVMLDCTTVDGYVSTRHLFSTKTTIVLLCLWTLYIDSMNQKALKKNISIDMVEFQHEMEKYGNRKITSKKDIEDALKELKSFNLVDFTGKIGTETFIITLYPSMQFALDVDEIERVVREKESWYKGEESI